MYYYTYVVKTHESFIGASLGRLGNFSIKFFELAVSRIFGSYLRIIIGIVVKIVSSKEWLYSRDHNPKLRL